MIIKLSPSGIALPDSSIEDFVEESLFGKIDIHTSQELVITCIRAKLYQTKLEFRPKIKWIFYNKEVHFDNELRSFDAWDDPRTELLDKFLTILCGWDKDKPSNNN